MQYVFPVFRVSFLLRYTPEGIGDTIFGQGSDEIKFKVVKC